MRISTSMIVNNGTQGMLQLQSDLFKLQNQMSTGRRVVTPSDDPVAAAQTLIISQRQSVNDQFIKNQSTATSQLNELETRLDSVNTVLADVISKTVDATSASYTDTERKMLAADIRSRYDQLLGIANATDASGNYLFSGFRSETQPFAVSGNPGSRTVAYQGDGGQRQIQVDTGRVMDTSIAGSELFMRVPQGNGRTMVDIATVSGSTAKLGASSVVDSYDGTVYQLTFTSATTYDLQATAPGGAVTTTSGLAYTSGSDIVLGSSGNQVKLSLSGTPAAGDVFTLKPSVNQDVFTTLDQMITALETPVANSDSAKAALANQMTQISENLAQAQSTVLNHLASVGTRLDEVDTLGNFASDMSAQYQSDQSNLQELDYTSAISAIANRKMVLEAAQLSYKQLSQMSLFSYL